MVHLITGHAGKGHVTPADDAMFHAGVCGTKKYVLQTGKQFEAVIESNNLIKIQSGDLINQGRHINIPTNTVENAVINNGTQGKTRIDVIAIRYNMDANTGVESASLVVLQGAAVNTGQSPQIPAMKTGNIYEGDDVDDFPLYMVRITNLEITSITAMYEVVTPLTNMLNRVYPVGSIYMSVNSTNPGMLFGGTWQEIQGKFLLSRSSGHAAGTSGGAETVTLTADQMPSHTHTGPSHTHTGPSHTHTLASHTHTASSGSAGAHTHNVSRSKVAASGTARYAAQKSASETTHGTSSAGAHTHSITVNGSGTLTTGAAGTGATGAAGTGATGAAGKSQAHNNMPPFLTVYMWKRTA